MTSTPRVFSPRGLFDPAAAWNSLEPAVQRKLGAAVIAERLAWHGYGHATEREGLRQIALRSGSYIQSVVRSHTAGLAGANLPPSVGSFVRLARQCTQCGRLGALTDLDDADLPSPLVCGLCQREEVRRSEQARRAAARRAKP